VFGEALVFWLGPAWGHLISVGADFTVATSDDTTSLVLSWELDAFQGVHTFLVFVDLLFSGLSVSGVGDGGTELSDLSTEVGAFWVFVTSGIWNDGILGTS